MFFAGAPERTGDPAPNDIVTLQRGEFAIGWSPSLRHPVWAAYHVVKDARFTTLQRPNFHKDRSVASSPAAADYERSGLTNIAPQRPALNRGPWRELEQLISDLWTARYGEIWVIVGAVSPAANSGRTHIEKGAIDVPSHYYMLITAQDNDGVRSLAMLLPQSSQIGDFPVHSIVTINELEAATGLTFFPDMPKFLARPMKSDRPTRLWPVRIRDLIKFILVRFT